MKRRSHDEAEMRRRVPTVEEQTAGLPMDFTVERRDVRLDPPSVASGGSEAGAEHVKPRAEDQRVLVIRALARLANGASLSREAIHERTGIAIASLCGRLSELETIGHVERVPNGAVSKAGIAVLAYRLTEAGWKRVTPLEQQAS